jgi:hypothetical protein
MRIASRPPFAARDAPEKTRWIFRRARADLASWRRARRAGQTPPRAGRSALVGAESSNTTPETHRERPALDPTRADPCLDYGAALIALGTGAGEVPPEGDLRRLLAHPRTCADCLALLADFVRAGVRAVRREGAPDACAEGGASSERRSAVRRGLPRRRTPAPARRR